MKKLFIMTIILFLAACTLPPGTPETPSPEPTPWSMTPTPTPVVSMPTPTPVIVEATPTPVPHDTHIRTLTADSAELRNTVDSVNALIDACNAAPEQCRQAEVVIRINTVNTSLNDALLYLWSLE